MTEAAKEFDGYDKAPAQSGETLAPPSKPEPCAFVSCILLHGDTPCPACGWLARAHRRHPDYRPPPWHPLGPPGTSQLDPDRAATDDDYPADSEPDSEEPELSDDEDMPF